MELSLANNNAKTSTKKWRLTGVRKQLVNLIVDLVILFSFTTTIQSLIDSISLNKIVGISIVLFSVILFIFSHHKKAIINLIVLVVIAFLSFAVSRSISHDFNDYVFLFTTFFMIINISNKKNQRFFRKALFRKKDIIKLFAIVECAILAFLLLTKRGYTDSSWGEESFFKGFCNSQHTMASLCCFIGSFIILETRAIKKFNIINAILLMILTYATFEAGARVFLFPILIILLLFINYSFKRLRTKIILCCLGLALFVVVLLSSNMMNKFAFVLNNIYATDALSSFTNGRSEFWAVDFNLFLSNSLFRKFFGSSFSNVYLTNLEQVDLEIWAHNDIIHLLVGTGLIGTFIYVSTLISCFVNTRHLCMSKFIVFLLVLYVVLPLLLNGFFAYLHFVYSFVVLYFACSKSSNFNFYKSVKFKRFYEEIIIPICSRL